MPSGNVGKHLGFVLNRRANELWECDFWGISGWPLKAIKPKSVFYGV